LPQLFAYSMYYKHHIALFLLFLISFKILVVPFVYLDFELRKEYIIHNLCENRFKPQLHCDGKCYLAKQLQKVAEDNARNETQKQSDTVKKIIQEVFDETCFEFLIKAPFSGVKTSFLLATSSILKGFLSKPMMPPIA
jgi:phosphorylcholine metabolism protein LicD